MFWGVIMSSVFVQMLLCVKFIRSVALPSLFVWSIIWWTKINLINWKSFEVCISSDKNNIWASECKHSISQQPAGWDHAARFTCTQMHSQVFIKIKYKKDKNDISSLSLVLRQTPELFKDHSYYYYYNWKV